MKNAKYFFLGVALTMAVIDVLTQRKPSTTVVPHAVVVLLGDDSTGEIDTLQFTVYDTVPTCK